MPYYEITDSVKGIEAKIKKVIGDKLEGVQIVNGVLRTLKTKEDLTKDEISNLNALFPGKNIVKLSLEE